MCYRIAGNFDSIHLFWIQRRCRWYITSIWRLVPRVLSCAAVTTTPLWNVFLAYRTWLSEDGDVNFLSIGHSSCCFLPSKSGWSLPEWKVVSYLWLEPLVGWYCFPSEDGSIIRHDTRDCHPSLAQNNLRVRSEVTGVQYHPNIGHVFLTSEQKGAVCLRDERMAFGPLSWRSQEGVVQVVSVLIMSLTWSLRRSQLSCQPFWLITLLMINMYSQVLF